MFKDIPPIHVNQTSHSDEEGWRYTQGDKNARRPPELLTRDHVARCIRRRVWDMPGSSTALCSSTSPGSKRRFPTPPNISRRSFPACITSFKQLADIDITQEPMEVGPTTHYMMGGVRVDADSQMTDVAGLFFRLL